MKIVLKIAVLLTMIWLCAALLYAADYGTDGSVARYFKVLIKRFVWSGMIPLSLIWGIGWLLWPTLRQKQ